MKRLLIFVLLFFCLVPIFADAVYEIETSQGTQQVVIPEGYTEKDVLLAIAKAYYELSWDFDELTIKAQKLSEDIDTYIAENKQLRADYEALIADYKLLTEKLTKLSKVTPVAAIAGIGVGYYGTIIYPTLNLGVELFEKFSMITSIHLIELKPSIGIGINYHF